MSYTTERSRSLKFGWIYFSSSCEYTCCQQAQSNCYLTPTWSISKMLLTKWASVTFCERDNQEHFKLSHYKGMKN